MKDVVQVGTNIQLTLTFSDDAGIIDISGASKKEIILVRPDNSEIIADIEFITDGKDGKIKYTFAPDMAGIWKYQIHLTEGNGQGYSEIKEFSVEKNL